MLDEYPVTLLVAPAKDVLVKDEERPVLFNATDQPLKRAVGFRLRGA